MIRKPLKIASFILTLTMLGGCNGFVKVSSSDEAMGYKPIYSGFPLPYVFAASSVQWNEDYAVSAGHTPFLSNVAYRCSTGCDLVFIKTKSTGNIPEWKHSITDEHITSYGNTSTYLTAKSEGNVLKTRFIQESEGKNHKTRKEFYKINSSASVKGMSGGPVYSQDGKVVGITLGFVIKSSISEDKLNLMPELKKYDQLSYMLQTEIIEREWKIFQKQEQLKHT
jgi:hypothetical protein